METIVIVLFLVVLIFIGVSTFNGIVERKNAVERGWAGVITQERQKNKILPELEKIVNSHQAFESKILEDITKLRSGIAKLDHGEINTNALSEVENLMTSLTKGIQVTMEAYPELKTAGLMNNLMREISEQQENIGAALRIFNQNVEAFNSGIQVFPNSLVNSIFNKESKIKTFSDSEAESGFEYRL